MPAISSTSPPPGLPRSAVVATPVAGAQRPSVLDAVKKTLAAAQSAQPAFQPESAEQQRRVDAAKVPSKSPASTVSKEELARQVHELQAKMDKLNPALAFVVDEDSGRTLLQLTDRTTKEVILQFPTQAALQISKALDRFQKGQLVNRTV